MLAIFWLFMAQALALGQVNSQSAANSSIDAPSVEEVSLGFGGRYKVGHWTPVRLTLKTGAQPFAGQLTLEALDAEGGPCLWSGDAQQPIQLGANQSTTVTRYLKVGRLENRLTAILSPKQGPSQRIRLDQRISGPAPTTQRHAIHIGSPLDWDFVTKQRRSMGREAAEVIALKSAAELPDSPLGYDGLDFISITTSDLSLLQQASPQQIAALLDWVLGGGRLFLSAGQQGEKVVGPSGILAPLAPGKWESLVRQASMKGLEGFVHAEVRLDSVGGARDRDFGLPLALLTEVRGRVLLEEAGDDGKSRPLAISAPSGFGQVLFVAVDLDQFPFSSAGDKTGWASTPNLLEKLVDELMGHAAKANNDNRGSGGNLGYNDLSGQFQTALDRFPGVSLVPFSALIALIVGYALIVTVADYFFLKKVVKRMQWTWLTFPLVALIFCGVVIGFLRSLRSETAKARQVEVVDIDAANGNVRGRTWLHLYSPETAAYRLSFSREAWKDLKEVQTALSWHGMPGKGVSGMDRRALTSVFDEAYAQSAPGPRSEVEGLPIQYASSRRVLEEWSGKLELGAVSELKTEDGTYLRGSLVNPLPYELDGVVLVYRNSAYRFNSPIAAGGRQFIDPSDAPLNLNWLVTQRRTIETKDVSTPWDPTSENISRLVEMFTFHEAAGAESYTGLVNRYYRSLDLSEHAVKGTAILYGRIKPPISKVSIENRTSQKPAAEELETFTFVRILLPVVNERTSRN